VGDCVCSFAVEFCEIIEVVFKAARSQKALDVMWVCGGGRCLFVPTWRRCIWFYLLIMFKYRLHLNGSPVIIV
jgi:hypothetical protein